MGELVACPSKGLLLHVSACEWEQSGAPQSHAPEGLKRVLGNAARTEMNTVKGHLNSDFYNYPALNIR